MSHNISKQEYYMNITKVVSEKATCLRGNAGAVIVKNDHIIATGYNGAPRHTKDSIEHGFCLREKLKIPHGQHYEICRSVHAEQNCIINAARAGVSVLDGDMYIYLKVDNKLIDAIPCFICKKIIINAGIKRVFSYTKDNKIRTFKVGDWIKEWQTHDLLDAKDQYGK